MRDKVELTGMVLSSTLVGDYDKRLVLLTKERGKITAFAKGARRPNSPYLGISEPFNFGTFTVLEGFDAYRLLGADIKEYFLDVKNDMEGICYGAYFSDVLEYLCMEGMGDIHILNLMYVSLKALSKPELPNPLVRRIFELKALTIEGEGMAAFSCARCGKQKVIAFEMSANGLICADCLERHNAEKLSESAIYTLQYIMSASLDKLYTFQVSEQVFSEIDRVIGIYFSHRVNKKFNSLQILSSMS